MSIRRPIESYKKPHAGITQRDQKVCRGIAADRRSHSANLALLASKSAAKGLCVFNERHMRRVLTAAGRQLAEAADVPAMLN